MTTLEENAVVHASHLYEVTKPMYLGRSMREFFYVRRHTAVRLSSRLSECRANEIK